MFCTLPQFKSNNITVQLFLSYDYTSSYIPQVFKTVQWLQIPKVSVYVKFRHCIKQRQLIVYKKRQSKWCYAIILHKCIPFYIQICIFQKKIHLSSTQIKPNQEWELLQSAKFHTQSKAFLSWKCNNQMES